MNPDEDVSRILDALPCSVELPAGTGKTELIARLVASVSHKGQRSLILTHTHAGIDVLRRRFKRFGIPQNSYSIRTIDSWSFDLISKMPELSGIVVGDEPDWKLARDYHAAAQSAVQSTAITRMLEVSYDLMFVDEYQDCQLWQHELIASISNVVPTAVLGDRMQGLFFFNNAQPVDWEMDVIPAFPSIEVSIHPWRWQGQNPDLGDWLLEARTSLLSGDGIDLDGAPITLAAPSDGLATYHAAPRHPETTVAIAKWPSDAALLARKLGGAYTMIEEIEGKHLRAFATIIDANDAGEIAAGTVQFAIDCAFGLTDSFPMRQRNRLRGGDLLNGAPTSSEMDEAVCSVNALFDDASASRVRTALLALSQMPSFRLYRREAWFGVLDALRLCEATEDLPVLDAVVSIRTRVSRAGRRPESRIVGRPLLIKGLEFDHAVVADIYGYNAHELYVVLSRASTSLTVITNETWFAPPRPRRA
ncbi:UvrD-helicase domain-containing protein [Plantibacter sp. T3]|uniref:UvrD-helicase domain-containing protein n=1 Tax=Plantibacter sp. T3 TaxID=2653161 RepID=UPI0012F27C4D|nr:UvrD-helicase domain-containing protein [Plantibacter sp. T3]VXB28431.1 conserved hypothetical protein [Plantibacter sp. T3]